MHRPPIDRQQKWSFWFYFAFRYRRMHTYCICKYTMSMADCESFGWLFLICNACDAILGAVIFQSVSTQLPIPHRNVLWLCRFVFILNQCAWCARAPTDIRSMQPKNRVDKLFAKHKHTFHLLTIWCEYIEQITHFSLLQRAICRLWSVFDNSILTIEIHWLEHWMLFHSINNSAFKHKYI